jgi:3-dehydroquinate synthetase
MAQDKKAEGGQITLVLPTAIGASHVARNIDPGPLTDFLRGEGAL